MFVSQKKAIFLCFILVSIFFNPVYGGICEQSIFQPNKASRANYVISDPIEITSDEDFLQFEGSGTFEDPYLIENLNITTEDVYGIFISSTTKYFIIQNCFIDAYYAGIFLEFVEEGTAMITNNICSRSEQVNGMGICFFFSEGVVISNNICSGNAGWGMEVWGAHYSYVFDNICNNNGQSGIITILSDNSEISENICNGNGRYGIRVSLSDKMKLESNVCKRNEEAGLFLEVAEIVSLMNNTFAESEGFGILAEEAGYCSIDYNTFQNNSNYGIYFDHRSNNSYVHHNNFIDNAPYGSSQAMDEGENNLWCDRANEKGNFWEDWNKRGSYKLDGKANSEDLYPSRSSFSYDLNPTETTAKLSINIKSISFFLFLFVFFMTI